MIEIWIWIWMWMWIMCGLFATGYMEDHIGEFKPTWLRFLVYCLSAVFGFILFLLVISAIFDDLRTEIEKLKESKQ